MEISLVAPSQDLIPELLTLFEQRHQYDLLTFDKNQTLNTINQLIEHQEFGHLFLIATNSDYEQIEFMGYVVLCYSFSLDFGGKISIIDQLYITKEWRRHGVGTYIINQIEAFAQEQQCHAVTLETNIGNAEARLFYQQLDYMPRRQSYMMSKRLEK